MTSQHSSLGISGQRSGATLPGFNKPGGLLPAIVAICACALAVTGSHAQTVWKAAPATNNWTTPGNWTPGNVPDVPGESAVFGVTTQTAPTIPGLSVIVIDGITFNPGASSYTIDNQYTLFLGPGAGIVNNSGITQTINNSVGGVNFSLLNFTDTTAGNNVTINNSGGDPTPTLASVVAFNGASTAGTATINNSGDNTNTTFSNNSTAGSATIDNSGSSSFTKFGDNSNAGLDPINNAFITNSGIGSLTTFSQTSNAGTAFILNTGDISGTEFNNQSSAGASLIVNDNPGLIGSIISFRDSSTAGNAALNNLAASGIIQFFDNSHAGTAFIGNEGGSGVFPGSIVAFGDFSDAENAIIENQGQNTQTSFGGNSTAGSSRIGNSGASSWTIFSGSATGGNATITNSGAGSNIVFQDSATGGQAALVNANASAVIDISGLITAGMTVGSVAGDGSLLLGSKNLVIGGNNASTTFSGLISGIGGSITKAGSGALTLTGANTFSGGVTINAGALAVGSSQALGLGSVTINGGTLQTANGPRVINVATDYTQNGGALQLGLAGSKSGQFDNVSVGGAANLGGTLQLKSVGGYMPSGQSSYTLLSSTGPVNGQFQNFDNPFAGTVLLYELVYNPNSVVLQITQGSFTPYALTMNQTIVARALNNVAFDPRAKSLIQYLNMQPTGALPADFDAIAPEELSAAYQVVIANSDQYRMNLEQQFQNIRMGTAGTPVMAVAASTEEQAKPAFRYQGTAGKNVVDKESVTPVPEHRWGVFGTGFGDWVDIDGNGNADGYTWTTGGFVAGANYRLGPNMAVGVAAGYSYTKTDFNSQGHLNVDDVTAGFYATYFDGPLHADLFVGGGYESYDSQRSGLQGNPNGDTEGGKFDTFLSTGYDLKAGKFTFTPTASLQYTYVGFNGFTENGSLAPLNIHSDNWNSLRSILGARMNYLLDFKGIAFVPELRLAWLHEYLDNQTSVTADFANGAGSPFAVFAPTIGRDSMLFGASLSMQFTMAASAFLSYDAQFFRNNYTNQTFGGGLRFKF